jgi:hypothetical protein
MLDKEGLVTTAMLSFDKLRVKLAQGDKAGDARAIAISMKQKAAWPFEKVMSQGFIYWISIAECLEKAAQSLEAKCFGKKHSSFTYSPS